MSTAFAAKHPSYASTRALDDLRAREYPLLDGLGQVYLDYTAGNLVPQALLERYMQAYPFDHTGEYLLTFDNDNSVNRIREFVRAKGCSTTSELSSCFHQPEHETHLTIDDFRLCIDGKSTGAVRVSLCLASNVADVDAFIVFAETCLV